MPSFNGTCEITGRTPLQACALSFDAERLQINAGSTPLFACDLGEIDVFAPGEHLLDLTTSDGIRVRLQRFGKVFDRLVHDLLEAHRARLVKCLLLADLDELARFSGTVRAESPAGPFRAPAEIRLYRTNLAVLPMSAPAFHLRLADVDAVTFDSQTYAVVLRCGDRAVQLTRLAKRTDECRERVQGAIEQLTERATAVLHDLVPFVAPERLRSLAGLMKEGHSVSLTALNRIDPRIAGALVTRAVDARLRPYYDHLAAIAGEDGVFTGFKLIRAEAEAGEDAEGTAGDEADVADAENAGPASDGPAEEAEAREASGSDEQPKDGEEQSVLHWFFFRIAPPAASEPMIAWEASSRAGRATYMFRESALGTGGRPPASTEAAVDRLGHGLALVNFRREPLYLPDASLEAQARFRRYAIASRRLPDLAALRRAFAGRAVHSSSDAWRRQVDTVLAGRKG